MFIIIEIPFIRLNRWVVIRLKYSIIPRCKRIVFQYPTCLRLFNLGWILNPLFYGIFFVLLYSAREIYYSNTSVLSTVVLGLICSESGLFISIFWGAFTTSWTTGFYAEGLYLPSPSSIVLIMTILLSALSVIVTSHYLKTLNMNGVSNYLIGTLAFWIIEIFCFLLVSEYLGLSIYINDNAIGTYMFMLTGVHFSHVVVGGILLFLSQPPYNDTYVPYVTSSTECNRLYLVSSSNEPFNILYLHFIECLWLSIQAIIYL